MSHILISYFNLSLFFSLEALLRIAPVVIWMKNIPCLAGNNVIILSPCVFLLLLFLLLLFFSYQRFMSQEIKDFDVIYHGRHWSNCVFSWLSIYCCFFCLQIGWWARNIKRFGKSRNWRKRSTKGISGKKKKTH